MTPQKNRDSVGPRPVPVHSRMAEDSVEPQNFCGSVRSPVLWVKHVAGAVYEDAWNGLQLTPKIEGDRAALEVELGPKGIGCVTQMLP